MGLQKEKIEALNAIGYNLTTAANYNAALEVFLQAKKLAENEQDHEEFLAASYHLIGNLYAGQRNYKDAINYYKKDNLQRTDWVLTLKRILRPT